MNSVEVLPRGLSITGALSAEQDVTISGRFEGQLALPDHHLSIDAAASVKARIVARAVTIAGSMDGTIIATEHVHMMKGASVTAHLKTPSLTLVDGAQFSGTVDPERTETAMHIARYRDRRA